MVNEDGAYHDHNQHEPRQAQPHVPYNLSHLSALLSAFCRLDPSYKNGLGESSRRYYQCDSVHDYCEN
jgi:hypothetical protein